MMKKFSAAVLTVLIVCSCSQSWQASVPGIEMSEKKTDASVNLSRTAIVIDNAECLTAKTATDLFAEDINMVTGIKPAVTDLSTILAQQADASTQTQIVIAGTIGTGGTVDALAARGIIETDAIAGSAERFIIKTVEAPFDGIERALVVAGSDRRGLAYGLFTLSEIMGVSPYYWWADIPVNSHANIYVKADYVSKSPSVTYRGFFINDEDWGLKPWSSTNYEKDLADIGPKTYEKVCELLLRLKGNMLAPAMHSCTGAFYTHPESKVAADKYGIMITTSHCEPLLFNNASKLEWDSRTDGEWNYATNRDVIRGKLDARVAEASAFENIYTVGMRGLHDEGMRGNLSPEERVVVLGSAISDERDILTKYIQRPADSIPQIFVPYKEALDVYEMGLQVPDDVTLVWPDDNYGYLKRVSNPEEQQRSGASGVYYHFSYLGAPHDYLWLCTTAPTLMYEELSKSYLTGGNRYWLMNVGDIKPAEISMKTFFDLAWDFDAFSYDNINNVQAEWLASIYGKKYQSDFQDILDNYYRLAWSRKPEYMGWEREWDSREYTGLKDTEFSFQNYDDAQQRLADYKRIADKIGAIAKKLPEQLRPSLYEMLEFPVKSAAQQTRKFLMAQLNHEQYAAGETGYANWAAEQCQAAEDSILMLEKQYNSLLDGKWNGMMMRAPAYCALYQNMPELTVTEGVEPVEYNLEPANQKLEGCAVIDLSAYSSLSGSAKIIEGIGYDWKSVQLGLATEPVIEFGGSGAPSVSYDFTAQADAEITVNIYTVPYFPLYKGRDTRFCVTVDGGQPQTFNYIPREYSVEWKTNVLRNGNLNSAQFKLNGDNEHTLTITAVDPGTMVQRIVLDFGGLKESYVGPAL